MQLKDTTLLVPVQLQWDGWRTAEVPLAALHDIHWFQPPGAPRPMVHAYVSAATLPDTAPPLRHAGETTQLLRVCVLKHHTPSTVYDTLSKQAYKHTTSAA